MSFLIFVCPNLSFAIKIPSHLKNPIGPAQARLVLDQVRESDLLALLIQFVSCCHPSRMVGTSSHLNAHLWLENFFKSHNQNNMSYKAMPFDLDIPFALSYFESQSANILKHLSTEDSKRREEILSLTQSRSSYLNDLKKKSVKGMNYFFEIKGTQKPEEIILLVTHFDTVTINKEKWILDIDTPNIGADANGSSVAALLMLSQVFSQLNLPRTVQFLFLDAQSLGSLGAHAYLKDHLKALQGQNIRTLQVMSIGHAPPRKVYLRQNHDGTHQAQDLSFIKDLMSRAQRLSPGIAFELSSNSSPRGDHDVFWEAGITGALLTQNWSNDEMMKRHHTSQDFVESLDRRAYYRSFRYLGSAVLSWAYQYSL